MERKRRIDDFELRGRTNYKHVRIAESGFTNSRFDNEPPLEDMDIDEPPPESMEIDSCQTDESVNSHGVGTQIDANLTQNDPEIRNRIGLERSGRPQGPTYDSVGIQTEDQSVPSVSVRMSSDGLLGFSIERTAYRAPVSSHEIQVNGPTNIIVLRS